MTPLESLSSPYEARIAPSSRAVAARMTTAMLSGASNLATMVLVAEQLGARSGITSSTFEFPASNECVVIQA